MSSKDLAVLRKIEKHTSAIIEYCKDFHSRIEFENNSMCVEATVFNLMQIGELAKTTLDDSLKQELPSIPWKQLYGMRNRIVHGYDGINMQIVWDTVSEDIPILRQELLKIITEMQ